ncbi:hypothetical protein CTAYLR_010182 [Chrysophaeum taylorii]|uniref:phosphorylase kinase n=1 Tax=Chrysophaeum taylorii TaxID=2483200 RepID=A0AAD7XGT9_9STRA|nr:hypothetical protein CTAYLR_010182 [Chrysophaeum taylorii]
MTTYVMPPAAAHSTVSEATLSEARSMSEAASEAATPPATPKAVFHLIQDLSDKGWTLQDIELMCNMWRAENNNNNNNNNNESKKPTRKMKLKAAATAIMASRRFYSSSSRGNSFEDASKQLPKRFKAAARAIMVANKFKASHAKRTLVDDFDFVAGGELGTGALSVVKKVLHKRTGDHFACKCVDKHRLSLKMRKALVAEATLMRELDHPNVVKLWHCYEDSRYFHIVMDLIQGGELFDRIVAKDYYNEREARDVVRTLLDVLGYLHYECAIVHRDIKPENILCVCTKDDTRIKLCDFGFAVRLDNANSTACLTKLCGTPQYVAPEILRRVPYGAAVDLWSVGVVSYILLSGYAPFGDQPSLSDNIINANYSFCTQSWARVSNEGKDFIGHLLTANPANRITAEEALIHPWIAEDGSLLEEHDLGDNLQHLMQFNAKAKFKAAAKTVIAARRIANGTSAGWTSPAAS